MAAKRHPNDRNQQALIKRAEKENLDELVLADGTKLILKDVDPIFIQAVINSVVYPPKPSYDVVMASGRIEQYPMDAMVAQQSPELKPLWDKYMLDQATAEGEQMTRLNRALILDGTVMPETWSDPAWERKMRIVGIPLPADPEERWVFYVETKMSTEESVKLSTKVMRRRGAPEELVAAAEDAFRDSLHGGSGESGNVVDADADQEADGEGEAEQVASQPSL